jgi:DNA-binding transcriptional MerR regulator
MPKKSKGGYVYNAMTQPMLAMGGPTDPPSNKLISNDKVLAYITDMNERGMLEPGKTFQSSWYSDLEKRQIDLNKELSPVDLGRVKSLYNYKQNNRNIFGFAQGGPMVSNVQQPFNGPAAQNRGGMMMANGGMMQQQGGQDQMMQLIQAYAQATGISPEEIIQQLQQMDPQSQEQAIQQMAQELQGSEQQSMQQQMSPQQGMMARGGRMYDGGGPYDLPGMADMSQSEYNSVNTYLNNLNTPNVVDNQGNTSSILDRMRKNNSQTTPNTMSPIESIKPINFLQNSQMPGIVGNQQEMPTFYSKPSNFNAEDIEIPSINPLDRSLKSLTEMPTLTGNAESMPALSNAATFISPYQKYLAENKPKVLDNLTFLEAEDEDEINFEYGTISNPYRKKSPASNSTTPWYDEPTYSKIARYLPLAASAAGIATGLKNKKRSLTPERISPEQINLERSRITSMEEGRRALDSGLRNVRGNSSNTGQLAANTRDMILNYNKNMGANIAKSYETEENTNAQLRQQSSLANQQYGNQFKQLNEEMFQNAQTIALRAAQEGAMLAQSGAEQERKQYLQEWIAKNRLNTRSYKTNIDGKDVYVSPDGKIYDEQGNPVT